MGPPMGARGDVDDPCRPLPPVTEVATDVVQRGTARLVAMKARKRSGAAEGASSATPCRPLW